jgi:hypothetical protein
MEAAERNGHYREIERFHDKKSSMKTPDIRVRIAVG